MSWRDDSYRAYVKWARSQRAAEATPMPTPAILELYIDHLRAAYTLKTRMTRLHGLQGALRERLPAGADLRWLETRVREEWARSGLGRRGQGPGRGEQSAVRRRRLTVEEWPVDLQARWRRATQEPASRRRYAKAGAAEEAPGPASRWAPATRDKVVRVIGSVLRAALDRALPLDLTPEGVQAFIDARIAKDASIFALACEIDHLTMFMSVVSPERDRGWLRAAAARLHALAARSPRKKELTRIPVAPTDVETLAQNLMYEARRRPTAVRSACRFRDGLLLLFLLHHPVRLRNLAEMRVGENLVAEGDGFLLTWEHTKNGAPRVDRLAERLVAPMRDYLVRWRPALVSGGCGDALWLSAANDTLGAPLTPNSLTGAIGNRVKSRLGARIWTHLFRHWAAMAMVDARPEEAHLVAPLLGHRDARSARFYITLARTRGAAARFEAMIERAYRPRKIRSSIRLDRSKA